MTADLNSALVAALVALVLSVAGLAQVVITLTRVSFETFLATFFFIVALILLALTGVITPKPRRKS